MRLVFARIDKLIYLLGIGLFVFILKSIDFGYYLRLFSQIKVIYVVGAILLAFPIMMIRAYRWQVVLKKMGIDYSFKNSFLVYLSSIYIGSFTPARLGEFSKVYYLKTDGHAVVPGLVSVFFDRLADLGFLILVGLASLFYFTPYLGGKDIIFFLAGAIIILFFLTVFIYNKKIYKDLLKKIFFRLTPKKYHENLNLYLSDMVGKFRQFKSEDYLKIILLTLFSWALSFLMAFWVFEAINLGSLGFVYAIIVLSLSMLISLIPVSIYGIGTRDALVIFLFALKGIDAERAIMFSMLLLLALIATTVFGFIAWILKPIRIKDIGN